MDIRKIKKICIYISQSFYLLLCSKISFDIVYLMAYNQISKNVKCCTELQL